MLDSPGDAVHKQLELIRWEGEQSWTAELLLTRPAKITHQLKRTGETVQVDRPKEFEETDTVFWEFGEVLVYHAQRRFEHGFQDWRYLGGKQVLYDDV